MSKSQAPDSLGEQRHDERPGEEGMLKELQASETRYRRLFESAQDGILILNAETGMVVDANPFLLDLLGYSREAFLTKKVWELGFLKEALANEEMFRELQAKGYVRYEDLPLETSDGRQIEVEFVSNVYLVNEHRVIQCNIRDITKRKMAEEELRASEERFHSLFERAPLGYQALDVDGKFIEVNQAWLDTLGYTRDEVIGKWFGDFLAPEYVQAFRERFPVFKAEGKVHTEFFMLHKDGSRRYIAFDGRIGRNSDGSFKQTHCILRDDTERKRAEETLQESVGLLRKIFEILPIGLWITDKNGMLMQGNPAGVAIWGAEPHVAPDQYGVFKARRLPSGEEIAPDDWALAHTVSKGETIVDELLEIDAFDGRKKIILNYTAPVLDDQGNIHAAIVVNKEITDQYQANKALELERNKLSMLLESLPGFIYLQAPDYSVRFANKEFIERFGEIQERPCYEIMWGRNAPCQNCPTFEVFKTKRPITREWSQAPDGKAYILYDFPFVDSDGKLLVLEFGLDITERKQAEAKLLELNMAVEQSGDGIALASMDGHIRFVNKAWAEMHGYAAEELIGQHLSIFHTPEQMEKDVIPFNDRLMEAGTYTGEMGHRRKDGSSFSTLMTNSVVRDANGKITGLLGVAHDITERKRAEAYRETGREILQILNEPGDLQESIQRVLAALKTRTGADAVGLRLQEGEDFPYFAQDGFPKEFLLTENTLVERGRDGGVCRDKDGKVLLECTCGLVISGKTDPSNPLFTRGGSSWTNDSFPLLDLPSDQDPRLHPRNNCIHQGYASVALIPIRQNDRIVGLIQLNDKAKDRFSLETIEILEGIAAHIGSALMRKRAEGEREKLQARLNQAWKMESVGRLAGGVAHDFNNMLGVILGHAEIVLDQMDSDHAFHADIVEIRKAGERSADLTRQLLAFARKQTIAPKVLDLNESIASMLKMLERLIGEYIDLLWKPGHGILQVKMDPAQIDQILVNLCVNARDAIADVGKITIETDYIVFEEEYCNEHAGFLPGEYAMMAVSDDGCGMDAETRTYLFEPFFTTKEIGKGTGLGLATVYGIVKQNNGFINVYSEPGQGTTFNIYLPRHAANVAETKGLKPQAAESGSETILLVEDEPAILTLATTMLERLGYTVVVAPTPGEAIRLAREHAGRIDLLMTDVVMPEMNGRDLAKNLLSLYPEMRRLFMSGYTSNVIAHHGVLDAGVHFIQKPFTMSDLGVKLREALGG